MVGGEEQVHLADAVHRTRHLELEVLREISEIEKTERTERKQHSDRRGIVRRVGPSRDDSLTERIGHAAPARRVDQLSIRGEHFHIDSLQRNHVARLHHDLFRTTGRYCRAKRRHEGFRLRATLGRRAVRNNRAKLHARRKLRHAAYVIVVVVRDDEIVERADAAFWPPTQCGRRHASSLSATPCRPAATARTA